MSATNPLPSPIQVVLNAESFVRDWRRQGGGGEHKDFFQGLESEFRAHKGFLITQLEGARRQLARQDEPGLAFMKVVMRSDALAKSHRPVRTLFRSDRVESLGAAAPGELVFAVTADAVEAIKDEANKAEIAPRYKEKPQKNNKPNKIVANPSRQRSELGAIETVGLWSESDRRHFSLDQALRWLQDPRTGGYYFVELFDAPPSQGDLDLVSGPKRKLFSSFTQMIRESLPGIKAVRLALRDNRRPLLAVWVTHSGEQAELLWQPTRIQALRDLPAELDWSVQKHQELVSALERHPLVKRIHLPPILTSNHVAAMAEGNGSGDWIPPTRVAGKKYPRVAVVDGGLAPILDDWVVDEWLNIAPADESLEHGTFIGGLLVAGQTLNDSDTTEEVDGCELIDVKLLPTEADPDAFSRYYGSHGAIGFMQELADAVAVLRERSNVRVFNFSANFQGMADPLRYSPITAELDAIAESNDVIFVISSGNANGGDCRPEWQADPTSALADLASATRDRICSPAESIRNVSVGSLNPAHFTHVVGLAPAAYSRRGPGLTSGLKPDVVQVGGSYTKCPVGNDMGLFSIDPSGAIYSSSGTSYATPLVAKTLATLANEIEGQVSRETLIALLIHHSRLPPPLALPALGRAARDLGGFGRPVSASEILSGSDHQITMVFSARVRRGTRLEFDFTWPPSLSRPDGSCRGFAQVTLVATPPLDSRAEGELVRVELQAHLNQQGANGSHLTSGWLPAKPRKKEHLREAKLITESLKWSPVKIYHLEAPSGKGKSTGWVFAVDHLSREEDSMPPEGIPFTAIVTIGDIDGAANVFQEMRQLLQAQGAQLETIQTAARVSPRV